MATDEQIAEAFNAGYTMQKFEPALMEKLLSTKNESEIMQAIAQEPDNWNGKRLCASSRKQNKGRKTESLNVNIIAKK